MKKLSIIISITSVALICSCSKKSDPAPPREQVLASPKGWKQTAQTISPARSINGNMVTDYYGQVLQACKKDDILLFAAATSGQLTGSYTIDEGATKCNPSDPATFDVGIWTLNAAKTSIEFKSDAPASIPYTYTIVTLTSDTFKSTRTESDNSATYTYTVTYTVVK
jgi:hypothetical protein